MIETRTTSIATLCSSYNVGIIAYDKAMQLQDNLVTARLAGEIPDSILLLQHFPVLTMGVSSKAEDIVVSRDLLNREKIPIVPADRGGCVTYHGPGQLVGYLILDLKAKGMGIHQLVRNLEEVIIRTLSAFSIKAYIDPRYPGVWIGDAKICALGIRVIHGITKHGFALNINNDLKYFTYIIPCGITNMQVTSMSQVLGYDVALEDVSSCLLEQFKDVFFMNIEEKPAEELGSYYE